MPPFCTRIARGLRIRVHVQPNARRSEVAGLHGEALKIKIHAVPEDGKANAELISFLSGLLRLPKSSIRLVAGETSRLKTLEIETTDAQQALAALGKEKR